MALLLFYWVYLPVLFLGVLIGIFRFKMLDTGSRIILILLVLTTLNELSELFMVRKGIGKELLYHFFSIIEILLISIYFFIVLSPKKYRLYCCGAIIFWPTIGFLNMLVQPTTVINSNILIIESICIIAMSLYSLYKILLNDNIMNIIRYPHFWIWACLILYSSSTFFFWAFFDELIKKQTNYKQALLLLQVVVNIILYAGIGLTFLLLPKTKIE